MSTKRTTVAINSAIIEKIKSKQGRFFSLSSMVKSVLEAIAEGKLTCNENGEWVSSISIRVNVDLKEKEVIEQSMPERAEKEKFYREEDPRKKSASDGDLISDLKAFYQADLENTKEFDWKLCTRIMQLKYGINRKKGDDYMNEPDMQIESLYNYFQWNNRQKIVDKINGIVNQVIRWMKEEKQDY